MSDKAKVLASEDVGKDLNQVGEGRRPGSVEF